MILGNYRIVALDSWTYSYQEKNTKQDSKTYGKWLDSGEYYPKLTQVLNRVEERALMDIVKQDDKDKVLGDIKCIKDAIISIHFGTIKEEKVK